MEMLMFIGMTLEEESKCSSLPTPGSLNWALEELSQQMQTSQHASATLTNQHPKTLTFGWDGKQGV